LLKAALIDALKNLSIHDLKSNGRNSLRHNRRYDLEGSYKKMLKFVKEEIEDSD
jgi:hypothetical protein